MTWQEGLPDAGAPVADSTQVVPSPSETQLLNGAYGGDYTQVADTATGQPGLTFDDAFSQLGLDQTTGLPQGDAATGVPGDPNAAVTGDPNAGVLPQGDQTTVLPSGDGTVTPQPGLNPDGTAATTVTDQTGGGKIATLDQQGRPVLMDQSGQVIAVGAMDPSTNQPVMIDASGVVVGQVQVDQASGSATIIDQTGQAIPIQMMAQTEPAATGQLPAAADQTGMPTGLPTDQTGLPADQSGAAADQTALPTDQTIGKFATLDQNGQVILTDQTGRTLAVAAIDESGQPVMRDESTGNVLARLATDQAGNQAIVDATTGEVIPFVQSGQAPPGTTTQSAVTDTAQTGNGSEVNLSDVEEFILGEDPTAQTSDASVLPTDPAQQGLSTGQSALPNGTALQPGDTGANPYLQPGDAVADGPGTVASMTPDGMSVEGQTVVPPSDVQPQFSSPTFGAVISPEEQAAGIMPGMPQSGAENIVPTEPLPEDQRLGG